MAFCNSCGTALAAGAKFCPKCGAAAEVAGAPTAVPPVASPLPPAPPPTQSSNTLKIILIIVAVIIGLILLAGGSCFYFLHRIATHSHVNQKNGEVSIDTPFGSMNTTTDPAEAARETGVDMYPGATMMKEGSANVNLGRIHSASVTLQSSDSPSAVADFYKSKLPNANVTSGEEDHYSIISGDKDDLTTISIEPRDGMTRIFISRVRK